MTEDEEYQIGVILGEAILKLFTALAAIAKVSTQEAIEGWIGAYITERITQETE